MRAAAYKTLWANAHYKGGSTMQHDKPHPDNPAQQDDDAPKGPPVKPFDDVGPGGDEPPPPPPKGPHG